MTRIELYELLREAKISFEFDQKNNSFYGLKGDIKIRFSDLAKFIDEYFLPRPLFEDGTPVKVGDRVLLYGIADREVTDYCVCDDGSFAINNFQYDQDQRLKKPEKPEALDADGFANEDDVKRLADLIDRPTCKNAKLYKDVFECSECHCSLELITEVCNEYGEPFSVPFMPRYCPACGAEVVE